jgi:hypothetical protein
MSKNKAIASRASEKRSNSTRDVDSRAHDTREAELRSNTMHDQFDMDYISPLDIPDSVKKDGYSYRWVNTSIKGEQNYRIDEMVAKGWTLVPVDRNPNVVYDPLGRNPLSSQYICYKDVVLMERPSIYSDRERQRLDDINRNKIKSLRGVSNDLGNISHSTTTSIDSF